MKKKYVNVGLASVTIIPIVFFSLVHDEYFVAFYVDNWSPSSRSRVVFDVHKLKNDMMGGYDGWCWWWWVRWWAPTGWWARSILYYCTYTGNLEDALTDGLYWMRVTDRHRSSPLLLFFLLAKFVFFWTKNTTYKKCWRHQVFNDSSLFLIRLLVVR